MRPLRLRPYRPTRLPIWRWLTPEGEIRVVVLFAITLFIGMVVFTNR